MKRTVEDDFVAPSIFRDRFERLYYFDAQMLTTVAGGDHLGWRLVKELKMSELTSGNGGNEQTARLTNHVFNMTDRAAIAQKLRLEVERGACDNPSATRVLNDHDRVSFRIRVDFGKSGIELCVATHEVLVAWQHVSTWTDRAANGDVSKLLQCIAFGAPSRINT